MDGIVLLAKQPGITSFSSLHQVKRAIKSTKVGHTGTLDNFAQGLLVVCTGRLTRLAGDITEFSKTYKAVIKFGTQTSTLDYEGEVVETAELPSEQILKQKLKDFTGVLMQKPPAFSAIHVDGKRASDLARSGKKVDIPARKITVFSADLQEVKLNPTGLVEYCMIEFSVSKGTYIRSLARDLANACGSCGHLVGLYRTKVGTFNIEDAAFYSRLPIFNIKSATEIAAIQIQKQQEEKKQRELALASGQKQVHQKPVYDVVQDQKDYDEILAKMQKATEEIAGLCGFGIIHLTTQEGYDDFMNGRPLKNRLFIEDLYKIPLNTINAVFGPKREFAGLISKDEKGKIRYKLVIN